MQCDTPPTAQIGRGQTMSNCWKSVDWPSYQSSPKLAGPLTMAKETLQEVSKELSTGNLSKAALVRRFHQSSDRTLRQCSTATQSYKGHKTMQVEKRFPALGEVWNSGAPNTCVAQAKKNVTSCDLLPFSPTIIGACKSIHTRRLALEPDSLIRCPSNMRASDMQLRTKKTLQGHLHNISARNNWV